jgi:hypothetical protein
MNLTGGARHFTMPVPRYEWFADEIKGCFRLQGQVEQMRLDQIFKNEYLSENLSSNSQKDVLAELINVLINSGLKIDKARAIDVLQQREKLGSTGLVTVLPFPMAKFRTFMSWLSLLDAVKRELLSTRLTGNRFTFSFYFWHRKIQQDSI